MARVSVIRHQLADFCRLLGLRDRLRCPACRAVGTWKPHGGWLDREDERKVRRWMCKCCGIYAGPEGVKWVVVDTTHHCWRFTEEAETGRTTPADVLRRSEIGESWPWRG